jgi:hypothetical protein
VLFGVALVVWAFGWTGGRTLVESSYADAKTKVAEQRAERAARKAAEEPQGGTGGLMSRLRAVTQRDDEEAS